MKIKHRKNSIYIKSNFSILPSKDPIVPFAFILGTYLAISIYLSVLFPQFIIVAILGLFIMLIFKKEIKIKSYQKDIKISKNGILIKDGKKKELFRREEIHELYIQEIDGIMKFFINGKMQESFSIQKMKYSHNFIVKTRKLLKLDLSNTKKTYTGKIQKFISGSIIDIKKNHINNAKIKNESSTTSKSKYFTIDNVNIDLDVKASNNIALHQSRFILDSESNSIKIRLDSNIPDEINFDQIASIKVSIIQNASGEPGDLVEGKLLIVTNDHEVITLFHTKVKEKHHLDFISDQLEQDLTALKATIEFFIYSSIDQDLDTLDLDALNEEHQKQKDILPNRNDLEF